MNVSLNSGDGQSPRPCRVLLSEAGVVPYKAVFHSHARPPLQTCLGVVAGGILLLLAGCTTADTRAREMPAALRGLSPADQQLALSGRIREGFSKDAVYVAWGAPSRTDTLHVGSQPLSYWLYTHVQYGEAGGYFGVSRGFYYHGRYIDPAPKSAGSGDFYVPPPYIRGLPRPETDVPYKKVAFENNRVIAYESLRGSSPR